jgi:hypothetical protein
MIYSILKNIIAFCLFLSIFSCKGQDCTEIELIGKNYKETLSEIRLTSFNLTEKLNTNSSWIESIEYYSCDEVSGFLIMVTKKEKEYIHKGVTVNLWHRFKSANSFGRFYTSNIKGKYRY